MNVLAFDTSMGALSVALFCGELQPGKILAASFCKQDSGHAEQLFPDIQLCMKKAGLAFSQIDRIAVTVGPGSFTGVRVGVAAARGLSLATGAPAVGATALEVMALGYLRKNECAYDGVVVAVDARRDEIYLQPFTAAGRSLAEPCLLRAESASCRLPEGRQVIIGSGAMALVEAGAQQGLEADSSHPDLLPDAADLARMAPDLPLSDVALKPLYLRPPDAKPQTGKSIERAR